MTSTIDTIYGCWLFAIPGRKQIDTHKPPFSTLIIVSSIAHSFTPAQPPITGDFRPLFTACIRNTSLPTSLIRNDYFCYRPADGWAL